MYKLTWTERYSDGTTRECFDTDDDPVALIDWFDKDYRPRHPGVIATIPELKEVTAND